jgi:hypothetical protein
MKQIIFFLTILFISVVVNCTSTERIKKFNNTSTPMGKPKYYQTTTNIAVQFFFGIVPIHEKLGNSSFEQTLDDFTEDAVHTKLRSNFRSFFIPIFSSNMLKLFSQS